MRHLHFTRAERLVLASCTACLVVAALLCAGEGTAVAAPWWMHPAQERTAVYRAGNFGLSVQLTHLPGCSPLQFGCMSMTPGNEMYLSVWFSVDRQQSAGQTAWARPLLQWRVP